MANTYQFVSRTSASAVATSTVVVTSGAGQAIPRGSLVVIRFANTTGLLPSSVVDSAGHTYVLADSALSSRRCAIYYCVTTKALPAGATFTANVVASSSSRFMDVLWCSRPNGTTATVLDTAASNGTGVAHATATGTAAATAAITPSTANSLLVSATSDAGAASSLPAASWTEDSDVLVTAASLHMETQTRILTAASSVAAGATLATSQVWEEVYAVFKLKPPIAYVKTASWNNTSSPPSTLAATVTQNAAVGDHILVRIFTGGLNPASACVDSVGNTYVRDDTGTFGGTGADYALFRSKLQFAHVAASTTITITGGASAVFYAGDAIKVTGATSITRGQFTTSAEGTGTTVASPTIIPVTADWIALGGIDASFTSATPGTTGGTWVEDTDANGTETQTLISTTFAQAAVGFAATVTPTQTFIDLGWNILQVDKPVVEIESVTGSSAASKTETFRAAAAGDLLLLIVGTNENTAPNNVTTPTGWTQLAQSRSGTTNVNLTLFGKIAVGGETSVLAAGSSTARIQTAFANLGQGYSLTIDVSNTANSTSSVLTGAVGSVTPTVAGGIAISAIVFKNAETTLVAGPANSTPYDQLGVNNEGSTASTQKVTVGWFYSENVVTTLAYDNAPVATGTAAPYAGLNVVLKPAAAATPAAIVPASTGVSFDATGSLTAPSLLAPATASVTFSSSGAITSIPVVSGTSGVSFGAAGAPSSPVALTPASAGVLLAASGSVSAPTRLTPATAGVSFGASGALAAPQLLAPAASGVSFGASGSLAAPQLVAPSAAGVAFGAAGSVTSIPRVVPAAAGVAFSGSGSVTAPTSVSPASAGVAFGASGSVSVPSAAPVVPAAAGVTFGASGTLTAPALISSSAGVALGASGSLTATPRVSGSSGVAFAASGSLAAPTSVAPAAAGVSFAASGSLTATPNVTGTAGVTFAGSGALATPAAVSGASSGVSFGASGTVTAPQILTGSSGVAFGASGAITSIPRVSGSSGLTLNASGSLAAPTSVSPASAGVSFSATGSITSTPRVSGTAGVSFQGTGTVLVPGQTSYSPAGVTFTGSGSLSAPTFVTPATAGVSFAATGSVTAPARVAPAAAGVTFAASGTVQAPQLLAGSSGVAFAGTGSLTSIPRVSGLAGVSFGASGVISANTTATIVPATAGVSFAGSGSLTAPPRYSGLAGVSFAGTGAISAVGAAGIVPAAAGVGFAAAGSLTAPSRVTFAAAGVVLSASGAISDTPTVSGTSALTFTSQAFVRAPAQPSGAAGVVFSGSGRVITLSAGGLAGVTFGGTLNLIAGVIVPPPDSINSSPSVNGLASRPSASALAGLPEAGSLVSAPGSTSLDSDPDISRLTT